MRFQYKSFIFELQPPTFQRAEILLQNHPDVREAFIITFIEWYKGKICTKFNLVTFKVRHRLCNVQKRMASRILSSS